MAMLSAATTVPASDRPPVVLVTGTSSGLGLALARLLWNTSYRVVATARESSLHHLAAAGLPASDRCWIRPLDITCTDQRSRLIDEINERWGGVDILVNNAGVAYRTVVEHFTEWGRYDQMNVNFRSPMELIRLVLPGMRARRAGRIINVSSVGGMMAMPTMALYSASKFALEGASEALWYEVRPWNIHVSLVQPGFIRSDSFEHTRYTDPSRWSMDHREDPYHPHYENMSAMIQRYMKRSPNTPEDVARVILRTMRHPRPALRVPATLDAHLFGWLRRLLPRGWYHRLLYSRLPRIQTWADSR